MVYWSDSFSASSRRVTHSSLDPSSGRDTSGIDRGLLLAGFSVSTPSLENERRLTGDMLRLGDSLSSGSRSKRSTEDWLNFPRARRCEEDASGDPAPKSGEFRF